MNQDSLLHCIFHATNDFRNILLMYCLAVKWILNEWMNEILLWAVFCFSSSIFNMAACWIIDVCVCVCVSIASMLTLATLHFLSLKGYLTLANGVCLSTPWLKQHITFTYCSFYDQKKKYFCLSYKIMCV